MAKESSLASLFDHLGTDGETNLEGRLVISAGPPRKKMCPGSGSRNRKADAAFVSFRYVQCPECGQSREAWQSTKDGYALTPRHYIKA
jgi:hypothetical protein